MGQQHLEFGCISQKSSVFLCVRDAEAVGSSPVTSTSEKSPQTMEIPWFAGFFIFLFCFFNYCKKGAKLGKNLKRCGSKCGSKFVIRSCSNIHQAWRSAWFYKFYRDACKFPLWSGHLHGQPAPLL